MKRARLLAAILLAPAAAGCDGGAGSGGSSGAAAAMGLQARPAAEPPAHPPPPGLHRLRPGGSGQALLYVPRSHRPSRPAGLALVLHGAGGKATKLLRRFVPEAERHGGLLLAIRSTGHTWDFVTSPDGEDAALADRALAHVFRRVRIAPARVGVTGFSDGASYALSLGIANGDLLRHVAAFSPGFADLERRRGDPSVFISHGTEDRTLPIGSTSRRLVPRLRELGLDVDYREFPGGHEVPRELIPHALSWLAA